MRTRISDLNSEGNRKARIFNTSLFKWFATAIKRILSPFSNRGQRLDRALNRFEEQENQFINTLARNYVEAFQNSRPISKSLTLKIENITSEAVYTKIKNKILEELEPEDLKHLPVPLMLLNKEPLSLFSRTVEPDNEKEALSFQDLRLIGIKWEEYLLKTNPDKEGSEEHLMLQAFIEATDPFADNEQNKRDFTEILPNYYTPIKCFVDSETHRIFFLKESDTPYNYELTIIDPSGAKENPLSISTEILSSENLDRDLIHKIDEHPIAYEPPLTSGRVVNRLMRHIIGENYDLEKLLMEDDLLKKFEAQNPDWASNPTQRSWMKETLINLYQRSEKISTNVAPSQNVRAIVDDEQLQIPIKKVKHVKKHLQKCRKKILQAEKAASQVRPFSSIGSVTSSIDGVVEIEKQFPLEAATIEGEETFVQPKTLEPINFSNPEEALQQTEEWLTYIEELTGIEQFEAANRAAMLYLEQLKGVKAARFVRKIPNNDEAINAWAKQFDALAEVIVATTFAMGRPCVPHTQLAALLRGFEVTQLLFLKHSKDDHAFGNSSFQLSLFKNAIQDPYLDLGSSGGEILDTLERMKKHQKKEGYRMDSPSNFARTTYDDNEYFDRYYPGRNKNICVPTIQHTYRLMALAFAPAYSLSDTLPLHPEADITREAIAENRESVKEKLQRPFGPITFTPDETSPFCFVEPYGLRF